MDIEDLIDRKSRIKQGIFFTRHHMVDKIISKFDFNNIKTVVDSAAGSCNFLIPLAAKYPNIKFYGVEKNDKIFNTVSKEISGIHNLYYFHGDIILDEFPIPKCDLYLGNPPFINFSDLDEEYRSLIKPIWLKYFPKSKGFKMLLGDSRGDISQLIFALTIKKYICDGAKIGVILPDSLIKGNSASAGFREFKNITTKSLHDISRDNPFDNTSRNCFYIIGQKGGETTFPLKYIKGDLNINLVKAGDDLIEYGKTILKKSEYIARQGVNTLGANKIFIFKSDPPIKSKLIHPLLKSSDIHPFSYSPSYNILLPYENGKPILEDKLEKYYPNAYRYLLENKEKLISRKSRFVNKCWYGLFGVGAYTGFKYKVVWRGLGAKELMASVTEDVIPNQSMNCYIPTENIDEAYYIAGIMNSPLYKNQLKTLNEEGAKSFAQPSTINKIFIPKYNKNKITHYEIHSISKNLHKQYTGKLYKKLDPLVKVLYTKSGLLT